MATNFNFASLAEGANVEKVKLSKMVTVTVNELPVGMLLKFKRLRGLIASAAARFTQTLPLGSQVLKTEKVPLTDKAGKPLDQEVVTEISDIKAPEIALVDKTVALREKALVDAGEVLFDDDIFYDLVRVSVIEFRDISKEELFHEETGLKLQHLIKLATAIVNVNGYEIDKLGNFLSLLKQKTR